MNEVLSLADAQSLELWQTMRLGYTDSLGHPLLDLNSAPDGVHHAGPHAAGSAGL